MGNYNEKELLESINKMCEESLSPELFEKWEEVRYSLSTNRQKLSVINKTTYKSLIDLLKKCNSLINDFQIEVSIENDDVLPYSKIIQNEIESLTK